MGQDAELQHLDAALELVAGQIVAPVAGMHRVISDRAFRWVGPIGEPVRRIHDSLVDGVYRTIPRAVGASGRGIGALLAKRSSRRAAVSETPAGSRAQAVFNAVWGDRLHESGNALSVSLGVRQGGRTVAPATKSLAGAFPNASDHVVVLVHGLGQTEAAWLRPGLGGVPGLHDALDASGRATPVLVRYNTGLSSLQNGAELATLIEGLAACWPVDSPKVSLVGFSMGGLVARSALASGVAVKSPWTRRLCRVVTIGTPHRGTPVARGAQLASWSLRIARTTRPLGAFLAAGSRGLADLRDGGGVARIVSGVLAGSSATTAEQYLAGVVTRRSTHAAGAILGDLMVRVPSATGPASSSEDVRVIGRRRHFDLLADPDVIDHVVAWLGTNDDGGEKRP
jgi:triacylglycerol esterase/lipase EstA (alpha/beta hydrolase family)